MSSSKNVLIVADDEFISKLTKMYIKLENYDAITFSNGDDALNLIEENHDEISLVLLDLMAPGANAFEILETIKKKYPRILVVLFTAKLFFEDIQKGKQLGADGYIIKRAADFAKFLQKLDLKRDRNLENFYKWGDNDDERDPYPYIYKPPFPPDDLALADQAQLRHPPKNKDSEEKISCQYCGMELTKEELPVHSCKKKPKEV
jgi:CheY-like chemotaxis protein